MHAPQLTVTSGGKVYQASTLAEQWSLAMSLPCPVQFTVPIVKTGKH